MSPFRRPSAPSVKLARLCLCLSLLTAQLMPTFERDAAAAPAGRGAKPSPAQNAGAPAVGLPDLDEARRGNPRAPKVIAPVASKRRRCPPRNPRCNDDIDGKVKASPSPTPSAKPGHAQGAQEAGQPRGILASYAMQSVLAVLSAAMNGGYPVINVPLAEYLGVGGSYAVSDTSPHLAGLPDAEYAAAPAAFFQSPPSGTNVALAANGAVASASSTYNANYPASAAINGDRKGLNWNAGGGWNDANANAYPDWLEIAFAGSKTIGEIDVFTLQDTPANPSEPTEAMTFALSGITNFNVQYWNGTAWVTVPGGSVAGNNKVWRKFTFAPVTTTKIRVLVNGSLENFSRITEVEAFSQSTPYGGTPWAIPGTIQGEHFDAGGEGIAYHDTTAGNLGVNYNVAGFPPTTFRAPTDVDVYESAAYDNGYLVLSHAGDWMKYTVNVEASGIYTLEARVTWGGANGTPGTFHVELDGANVTGPVQIPDTNWVLNTVTKTGVQLTAGRHILRVVADTNAGNGIMGDIDYLRFLRVQTAYNGQALNIPGKIEAEHFDIAVPGVAYQDTTPGNSGQDYTQPPNYPMPAFRQPTDVDIYRHVNYSGEYLMLSHAGDWMKYTVDVADSGSTRWRRASHGAGRMGRPAPSTSK